MKQRVRLKAIRYACDFRKSDASLYEEFRRARNYPGDLAHAECYLFVSSAENQLIWFLRSCESENSRGWCVTFTDSRRWRFSGANRWDPAKLRQYAHDAGLQLLGLQEFDDIYATQRADRLERERKARLRRKREKLKLKILQKEAQA